LAIVDGRHRKMAYEMCDRAEVEVKVLKFTDEVEMITYAFRANADPAAPLPPSTHDIEHTVELLLERGQTIKAIVEALGLPAKMTRKFVQQVNDRLERAKVMRAAAAVTEDGMRVTDAAQKFGADPEKVKIVLSGNRKKRKDDMKELERKLTHFFKSVSQRNAATCRKMLEEYDNGDVSAAEVRKVLGKIAAWQKQSARALGDWQARFEAKFSTGVGTKTA
jgi:transposase-like protein